ncbi:MAG: IS1 family transposase [Phycisphaeraceae bacterium]|nr:IS1 family transposase [Phycisphaeraceae bacterium]
MNRLSNEKRARIVAALVEGCSVASTCRMVGVSKSTVLRLLESLGAFCAHWHDLKVRGLKCARVECDELWCFVHGREVRLTGDRMADPTLGDTWTWTSLCADSKLMIAWHIGEHTADDCCSFVLNFAGRIEGQFQLSTDGARLYRQFVGTLIGDRVDYGQVIKTFGIPGGKSANYARGDVVSMKRHVVQGNPREADINTAYVERAHLTIRMQNRRYTRLTNAQSKKLDSLRHSFALHAFAYNWIRRHTSKGATPAQAAGLIDRAMTLDELAALHEQYERRANSK